MATATAVKKREDAVVRPERTHRRRVYTPNVDILENREKLVLLADVPGAGPEDIDIQYEQGELAIRVRIDPPSPEDVNRFLWREYAMGDYHRSFQLGEVIDTTKIHAEVTNGVLTVHLPKVESVKPRKIAVRTA